VRNVNIKLLKQTNEENEKIQKLLKTFEKEWQALSLTFNGSFDELKTHCYHQIPPHLLPLFDKPNQTTTEEMKEVEEEDNDNDNDNDKDKVNLKKILSSKKRKLKPIQTVPLPPPAPHPYDQPPLPNIELTVGLLDHFLRTTSSKMDSLRMIVDGCQSEEISHKYWKTIMYHFMQTVKTVLTEVRNGFTHDEDIEKEWQLCVPPPLPTPLPPTQHPLLIESLKAFHHIWMSYFFLRLNKNNYFHLSSSQTQLSNSIDVIYKQVSVFDCFCVCVREI
jgi:hypothetical protein